MRPFFLICLNFVLFSQFIQAQLFCTNESEAPVWLAVAYNQVTKIGMDATTVEDIWVTEGWIYLDVGYTAQISTHLGFDKTEGMKSNFFYYAYQPVDGGKEWRGNRKFLVDIEPENVDPFTFKTKILFANMPEKYSHRKSIQYMPFKVATNMNFGYYTIVLKQDDEDEPPIAVER